MQRLSCGHVQLQQVLERKEVPSRGAMPLRRTRTLQVCSGVCVARSHRRAVESPLPLASWRPSGLKPTASTASVWPARVHSG